MDKPLYDIDPDLLRRLQDDLLDSYDEELEQELDDRFFDLQAGRPPETQDMRRLYFRELFRLQGELVKLQDWVVHTGERIVVLFEGRDTAGKGGAIKAVSGRLDPRQCRTVALSKPGAWGYVYGRMRVEHAADILAGAAAYARAIETAHLAAASLCGEKPVADPARKASPRALFHAMGMMYFLARLNPRDMAALFTGPGSFADFEAPSAFSDIALNESPGGSMSPFCEPATVTSTPHSS